MQDETGRFQTAKSQIEILAEKMADVSLTFIEGQADAWAARVNLDAMIENIASPMRLNRSAPADVRADFAKRMKEQMDALLRQAFIEGAALALCGFATEEESQ